MTREIRRLNSKWPPKTREICLAFRSGFTTGARKLLWDTTIDSKNLQKVRTSNQVQRRTTSQPTSQWLRCWRRPPRCRLSVGRSPCLGRSWPSYCWLGCPFVTMVRREELEEIASVGKTEGSWCMALTDLLLDKMAAILADDIFKGIFLKPLLEPIMMTQFTDAYMRH